ncbi:hypothetical protein E2C01_048267 [Portunus trituberculatus]|uniref:Uncharacterized protein n=1 Tax=Portunus trituberculatus TaxID=210409 RepID=A0A5B7GA47_PORTR|nr:hypothetical protein [Portunus trituberculatus]
MKKKRAQVIQERDLPPLQSDSPVVITVGPTVEEELSVVTAQPAMVAQQVGDLQPPATDQQAADLQQPPLVSPQALARLASLKAAAAKKLQVVLQEYDRSASSLQVFLSQAQVRQDSSRLWWEGGHQQEDKQA